MDHLIHVGRAVSDRFGMAALQVALEACEEKNITVRLHSAPLSIAVTLVVLHESKMLSATRLVNLDGGLNRLDAIALAINEARAHITKALGHTFNGVKP